MASLSPWDPAVGASGTPANVIARSYKRCKGQRVMVKWKWDGLWYPAKVKSTSIDGSFTVLLEDGFLQIGTRACDIRTLPGLMVEWMLEPLRCCDWSGAWALTAVLLALGAAHELKGYQTPRAMPVMLDTVWEASRRGDVAALEQLVAEGAPVDDPEPLAQSGGQALHGRTPLYLAAHCGHLACVVWLIQHGAFDHDGSALITASSLEKANETDDILFNPDEGLYSDFIDYTNEEIASTSINVKSQERAVREAAQIRRLLECQRGKDSPSEVFKSSGQLCAICMTRPVNAVCSPCGHAVCCEECLTRIRDGRDQGCPICRGRIQHILRA